MNQPCAVWIPVPLNVVIRALCFFKTEGSYAASETITGHAGSTKQTVLNIKYGTKTCVNKNNTDGHPAPKTNSKPSAAGSSWKGGAKERNAVLRRPLKGTALKRSGADFAPTWSERNYRTSKKTVISTVCRPPTRGFISSAPEISTIERWHRIFCLRNSLWYKYTFRCEIS